MSGIQIDSSFYLGSHLPYVTSKSLFENISVDKGLYCNACQIFMSNTYQTWRLHKFNKKEIEETQKYLDYFDIRLCSHAPYTLSLAKSFDQSKQMRNRLADEVRELSQLKANDWSPPIVFHPGSPGKGSTQEEKIRALSNVCSNLSGIYGELLEKICIEPAAGEGAKIPSTWKECVFIRERVKSVKWCLDTAHLTGSGMADLTTKEGVELMFENVENYIGWENILVIHLNDSEFRFNSKKDKHARIGCGEVWSEDTKPLVYMCKFFSRKGIMCVGEGSIETEDIPWLRKQVNS